MKFGESLSRHSAPELKPYNLDYDAIKKEIKAATSENGCSREREDRLLQLLQEELRRVDDFVKSKSGEIDRRIAHSLKSGANNRARPKQPQLKNFFKFDDELNRLTQDVRSLARYIAAQKEGFRKLVKKHAKWCTRHAPGADSLHGRFAPSLQSPDAFHKRVDFGQWLVQLASLHSDRDPSVHKPGSEVSVASDASLAPVNSITYWVHPDNATELDFVLLKYMALHVPSSSRKTAMQRMRTVYLDTDNLDKLREASGNAGKAQVPTVTWSEGSELLEATITLPEEDGQKKVVRVPRKHVEQYIRKAADDLDFYAIANEGGLDPPAKLQEAHAVAKSAELQPVLKAATRRTQFAQFSHETGNVSAFLDRDIRLLRIEKGKRRWVSEESDKGGETFPFAVLEVQWHGGQPPWLQELTASHLVELVDGFSLYVHAAYKLLSATNVQAPSWMSSIDRDIRKLPPSSREIRRKKTQFLTPTDATNESTVSLGLVSGASSRTPSIRQQPSVEVVGQRYWNEFDDEEHEEAWTVEVPADDERTGLLGAWGRRRSRVSSVTGTDDDSEDEHGFGDTLRVAGRRVRLGMQRSYMSLRTLFGEHESVYHPSDIERGPDTEHSDHEVSTMKAPVRIRVIRGYLLCLLLSLIVFSSLTGLGAGLRMGSAYQIVISAGIMIFISWATVSFYAMLPKEERKGRWIGWAGFALTAALCVGVSIGTAYEVIP
ncbi:hypothetical protein YB2330_002900 [Saitoella coloradoensis]